MATFEGIGISAVAKDNSKILYSVWGYADKFPFWHAFNVVSTSTGKIEKVINVTTKRTTGFAILAAGYNVRWDWDDYAETPPKDAVIKWNVKQACPRCHGTVSLENDYKNHRVILNHVSNTVKCPLETGQHESKQDDSVHTNEHAVQSETKNEIPITGMCTKCGNNLGNCTCHSNDDINKLDIIWNQALPLITKNVQTVANNVIELTNRVDAVEKKTETLTTGFKALADGSLDIDNRLKVIEANQPIVNVINITNMLGDSSIEIKGKLHKQFDELLWAVNAKNVKATMLVGPAGSGKSYVSEQVCAALGLTFDYKAYCLQSSKADVEGLINAYGTYVPSAFRRQFENGGGFLADEFDAAFGPVQVVMNNAIANGHCSFPDVLVAKHPDFRFIAACNTFGRGANRVYNSRQQLDGATLDRFYVIEWDYDRDIEAMLASPYGADGAKWCEFVWKCREVIERHALPLVCGTRSIQMGAEALASGKFDWEHIEKAVLWRGAPIEMVNKVKNEVR